MLADVDQRVLTDKENEELISELRESYHMLFFSDRHWLNLWCGVPIAKNPLDLWVYQEILWELRPEIIIETGTFCGGSALYLAMLLDHFGAGAVITIDNKPPAEFERRAIHQRIAYLEGDSASAEIVGAVRRSVAGHKTMVILDSDHSRNHVLKELDAYAPLVSVGQYLIVEDTNLNGHPVMSGHGPGPWEAVEDWLPKHPEFQRDPRPEVFGLTFNPGGFLLRTA